MREIKLFISVFSLRNKHRRNHIHTQTVKTKSLIKRDKKRLYTINVGSRKQMQ